MTWLVILLGVTYPLTPILTWPWRATRGTREVTTCHGRTCNRHH